MFATGGTRKDMRTGTHTRLGAESTIPSFREKPWVRFVSIALSLTLAFTMFDARGFESAFAVPDDSPSAAQTQESPTQSDTGEAKTGAGTDAAQDNASNVDAVADVDANASSARKENGDQIDLSPEADVTADSQPADPESSPEPSSASQPETASSPDAALEPDSPSSEPEPELPAGLIDAEQVLPQIEGGTADVAKRIHPALTASDAARDTDDAYLVKDARATLNFDLGALESTLEGGYVAGSESGDAFVLTLDAPYLYRDEAGAVKTTLSAETWKKERGDKDGMRVALYADELPEGWSLYEEHAGSYLPVKAENLKAGISGHIVLRYDAHDGKFDATAALPALEVGFEGSVPEDFEAQVSMGYAFHSFTTRAGAVERGDAESTGAASVLLKNTKSAAALSTRIIAMGGGPQV